MFIHKKMRKLTVKPRIDDNSLDLVESLVNAKFSAYFREFMKVNAGLNHKECIYIDKEKTLWEVNSYYKFSDMYKLTEEFINAGWPKMVPFAYDPGGWHFCICMEEKDFGSIFINRWTDHLPEDQFLKIAPDFEEFIESLKIDEN